MTVPQRRPLQKAAATKARGRQRERQEDSANLKDLADMGCSSAAPLQRQLITYPEDFGGFGGGGAGVGGWAVERVDGGAGGPWGKRVLALLGEAFLEIVDGDAG